MSQKNKKRETINYSEYERLLEVSKDDLKYNTYFDLAFTRGPRPSEVRAFRCCDYDEEKNN